MRIAAGILVLIVGVAFPMGMMFWLNGRMRRQPAPTPRQVGLLLAFNGVLPVGLILLGLGLLSVHLWAIRALRIAAVVALVTALALSIGLRWTNWTAQRSGGADDG